jgi:hypothetical protein
LGAGSASWSEAEGSHVIDNEQSAKHEARNHFLVDLGVVFRRLKIGEAKRDKTKENVVDQLDKFLGSPIDQARLFHQQSETAFAGRVSCSTASRIPS